MSVRQESRRVRQMERELGYDDDWETPTRPDPPGMEYEIIDTPDDPLVDGVIVTILPKEGGDG